MTILKPLPALLPINRFDAAAACCTRSWTEGHSISLQKRVVLAERWYAAHSFSINTPSAF